MTDTADPTAKKVPFASVTPPLPEGARMVTVSREYKHTNDDGKVVCTVRQAVNPVRQNKKNLKKQGLTSKQIKRIERAARALQRETRELVDEATSAFALGALEKQPFSPVPEPGR